MILRRLLLLFVLPLATAEARGAAGFIAASQTRPLQVDDLFALKDVGDPQVSPDGKWVAYSVTTLDAPDDDSDTDIYLAPLAGGEALRLTTSKKAEASPRFSPDGKWIAFLSARHGKRKQVFLLNRAGGEAVKLTSYLGSVSDLEWSPDSSRLALVVSDRDPRDLDAEDDEEEGQDVEAARKKAKTPPPLVIRRRQFKRDGEGYLGEARRHLHVFDVSSRASVQVTSGPHDDSSPAWSPDGQSLAFGSNRSTPDSDANQNTDVFVVRARAGETPRAVTTSLGEDGSPRFSPDGRLIAYAAGGDPADLWYGSSYVAVVPVAGGASVPLTKGLDRNVFGTPLFTPDGKSLLFVLEDGGNGHLAKVPVAGGAVERVVAGERDVQQFAMGPKGELVVLESQPHVPPEVSAVTPTGLRRVTTVNDAFLEGIRLGPVERFRARSADGTMIDGFLTRPPDAAPGTKLPAVLLIHGGPTSQYSTVFDFQWQVLAAQGYAVIAANPRGSTGYGRDFSRAIWADWGNKDYEDVMGAVDHVVAMGVADPERLGVGGWSYGGILTNYVITKTGRFKAAISGASEANYLANYGTDHYQYEWETELGLPWQNAERWLKLSPWYSVEKVTTPTLVLCGQDDMNVPLINSEQLYQALRRLGKETELVIYPGQSHSIETPSYQKDRFDRSIAWYDRYLKPRASTAATSLGPKPEATSLLGRPLFAPDLAPESRKVLEGKLAEATTNFLKDPDRADNIIWLGRRTAYLGRFREALEIFGRGIARHSEDIRLYRHRGHRFITVREFDRAIADLSKAAALIESKGIADAIEPDGAPNARNVPTSTSHFNVYYHLGLAHFLKGDFENAAKAYRECMKYSQNPDSLVATSDWLYMTLRRLGRKDEAAKLLLPIRADLDVVESGQYRDRLLMYKGEKSPADLLGRGDDGVGLATYGFGVGHWYLVNGQAAKAREVFERVLDGPQWAAFGFLAAEAELQRMK